MTWRVVVDVLAVVGGCSLAGCLLVSLLACAMLGVSDGDVSEVQLNGREDLEAQEGLHGGQVPCMRKAGVPWQN